MRRVILEVFDTDEEFSELEQYIKHLDKIVKRLSESIKEEGMDRRLFIALGLLKSDLLISRIHVLISKLVNMLETVEQISQIFEEEADNELRKVEHENIDNNT